MQKHYCSYELSMLAKKHWFDNKCNAIYYNAILYEDRVLLKNSILEMTSDNVITAPELYDLQLWVYEKFGVWVCSEQEQKKKIDSNVKFVYRIQKQGADISLDTTHFDCPYKALEAGLLEFLKQKTQ